MIAHKNKIQTYKQKQYKKHTKHTLCTFTEHYNIYQMYWPIFKRLTLR